MFDFQFLYDFFITKSSSLLSIIIIVIGVIYYIHLTYKSNIYNQLKSSYDILKSLNKEKGQVTLLPLKHQKKNHNKYKYIYNCVIVINAIEEFPNGFNLTLSSDDEFMIIMDKNNQFESILRNPKYKVDLNSDFFKRSSSSKNLIANLNIDILLHKKDVSLLIDVDFGSGNIISTINLNK